MKIAVLPGDGIGPRSSPKPSRCSTPSTKSSNWKRRRWAAPATRPKAIRCPRTRSKLRQGGRCHPVRRGGRLEVRQPRAAAAPRAGHPGPAQAPAAVRQLPPGDLLSGADRRLEPEARAGGRPRHPDRARAERRHLLRPAARHARGPGRPVQGRPRSLRHDALQRARDRAASPAWPSRPRAKRGKRCAAWTRPTCWRRSSSGRTS